MNLFNRNAWRLLASACILSLPLALMGQETQDAQDKAKQSKDWEKRYYNLLAESANDAIIREFILSQRMEAARVGLDALVDGIMNDSEVSVALEPEFEKAVNEYIEIEDISNDLSMERAFRRTVNGEEIRQHEEILKIVQEEARALGFSQAAVSDAKVWVPYSKTVNAYTYSGNPQRIRVVFYSALIDAYKKAKRMNSFRAVVRHELGHILKRDIRNQVRILSIFFAAGLDVIPDRPGDRLPMPVWAAIDSFLNGFFQQLTHRNRKPETAYTAQELEIRKKKFFELVKKIKADHSKASLVELAKTLAVKMGASSVQTEAAFAGVNNHLAGATNAGGGEVDIKAYFKLLEKLRGVWSNAVESGADRVVFTAPEISAEDAAYADAILLAGPGANLKALLAQHEAVIALAAESELARAIHYQMGALGSHPNLFDRMRRNLELEKSGAFRPWRDPFIGAAELWLDVSQYITSLEYMVEFADRPTTHLAKNDVVISSMKRLADGLANLLVEAVLEDLAGKDNPDRLEKFMMLRSILEKRIEEAKRQVDGSRLKTGEKKENSTEFLFADKWLDDVSKGGRVIASLIAAIETDKRLDTSIDQKVRAGILKQLREINPVSSSQRRNEELLQLAKACGDKSGGSSGGKPGSNIVKPGTAGDLK